MVCRVFQKNSGVKRYPTGQARANHYHHHLDMGTNVVAPMMQVDMSHLVGPGRSYVSNVDLAVFRASPGLNLPIQQPTPPDYPGNFTLSGINLNQHMVATGAPLTLSTTPPSVPMTDSRICSDMPHYDGGTRFHHMDPSVNLDGYWPPYQGN